MMSMNSFLNMRSVAALLLSISFLAAQTIGQQPAPKPAAAQAPPAQAQRQLETNISFDTMVSADSYKIYGEVRTIGQQVRSGGLLDVLEPVRLVESAPKEFKTLINFLTANADALLAARLHFATGPARSGLPDIFFALELSSPDEAMKFEPKLKTFLPTVLPTPRPTPDAQAETNKSSAQNKEARGANTTRAKAKKEAEAKSEDQALPFVMKRRGNLLLMSLSVFTFKSLLPDDSTPLSEDASFRQVRDRFTNDAVFVYYNFALQNQIQAQREKEMAEAAAKTGDEDQNAIVSIEVPDAQSTTEMASSTPLPSSQMSSPPANEADDEAAMSEAETSEPANEAMTGAELSREAAPNNSPAPIAQSSPNPEQEQEAAAQREQEMLFSTLFSGLFRGQEKWPDAVGIGVALEADDLILRALLVSANGSQVTPIPFLPALISGPQQTPESPAVLPSDTELFITTSLDLPQIYDSALGLKKDENTDVARTREERIKDSAMAIQIALFEKIHGFKIKEEFLATIGNEVAVALPLEWFSMLALATPTSKPESSTKPGIAILIALKDKEAFRALLPKVMDAFGIKQLAAVAQTQKVGDAEIVNYGAFSIAYVNNFLVIAPEPATINHVVEAYNKHETLSSNSSYRLATQWQPRLTLGQIYVSKTLMQGYKDALSNPIVLSDEESRQFLSRYNFEPEPLTYSLTNDGTGHLHELHIPRNLIVMAVAQASLSSKPAIANQSVAVAVLRNIDRAESNYKESKGKGNFASLDELIKEGGVPKPMIENRGYKFEVTIIGEKFTANALPTNYGKEGILSFHLDENGVIHAGDHRGQPASTDDPVVK
ncbi:MAG: DUF3352 domain-containing protein [Pyrinomonadaceae bacterium]